MTGGYLIFLAAGKLFEAQPVSAIEILVWWRLGLSRSEPIGVAVEGAERSDIDQSTILPE